MLESYCLQAIKLRCVACEVLKLRNRARFLSYGDLERKRVRRVATFCLANLSRATRAELAPAASQLRVLEVFLDILALASRAV